MKTKHLIFTLLALLTSITSSAYDFSQSGLYYNITSTSAKTVAVAGRTANPDDYLANLDIPSQVTYNGVTYNVTSIANRAFIGHEIHDVTLPEGIVSIGEAAFSYVPIYEVKIPASVQVIGNGAFGGCWDNCPEGEDYCWVYYPGKYTVDSNNQTYASAGGILYNKERTRLIDVPCGLNQDIYIPTTLEEMPSNAFDDCGCLSEKDLYIRDLTKFCQINVVGGSGNSVYGSVFSRVSKVYNYETFYWSDGGSHQEYVEITSTLTIPDDVKTIGRGIFSGWKTLSKVNFPSMGVTQIGDYAFAATKITQVTLPASIQTIGQNAFYQQWEEYVYDEDGDWSDTNIWTMAMSSLTIPQNVQSIGSNAFNLTNGAIVTSKNNTPNNISSNAFKNASNCTLTVGQGLQSTYSQKTGWNAFGTIEEDEDIIPYIDGEVFTATTPDGLEMTFKVLSASEKTVQVGDGENAAIDQSYEGDVIIPTQINDLTIKKIGNDAFKECKHLYFVDIPENVLLGDGAFSRANLKKIIVKTAISSATFWCANIGELIIESSVSYGGYQAFFQNKIDRLMIKPSETALTYSDGRNSYPMFQDCNIGTAIIERNMYSTYYGSGKRAPFMYSNIDSLYVRRNFSCVSSANIDNRIGDIFFENMADISSYYYKTSISRVHFSEGLSTIGSNAFNSSFVNNIVLPASLTSIGDNAISISSSPSVTSFAQTPPTISETSFGSSDSYTIPLYVPQGCREQYASATGWNKFTNIVELCEPENVIAFADEEAKKWCLIYYDLNGDAEIDENEASCVTSLIVRGNNADKIKSFDEISYFRNIETFGFRSCSSLQSITLPSFITTIDQNAFYYCSGLTSITIPNSVTSIGEDAFYGCSGLTSITIPNSVTSIGTNPFSNCSGLTSISVASGNTTYDSRNNCNAIIETDSNALIVGCENTVIPNSVTSIGNYAFYYCTGLTSIDIPNSVTSIGNSAFYGCSGLTSVTIGSGVTSIGNYAFYYCSSLTSFTNLSKTPQSISSITFSNRPNVTLYVPKGRKAAYEAANYWKDFKEIIEISDAEDGDIDGDGEIDVADIQHIINMIVGTEDITTSADLNGDGDVDIADIQAIINIIISNANASVKAMMPKRNQKEMPNEDYVTYKQANDIIDVSLNNDFTYSAFQMKVTLPEDVDITAVDFNDARMGDLTKFVKKVADGQYIIMGYSLDGYTIEGSDDTILTIQTSKPAQHEVSLTDVVFSTPNAVAYKLPVVGGQATGVKDIVTSSMKVVGNTVFIYNAESDTLLYIYSLNGSLVNRQALHHGVNSFVLPRGQYVINKQKVFIGK